MTFDIPESFIGENMGPITIVSGLPRSGTSMMMNMLGAGGMELVTDGIRSADISNPQGYFELERVRDLQKGDQGWLGEVNGKALKVVSTMLTYLPLDHQYRVVFMRRELDEILASHEQLLLQQGRPVDDFRDEEMTRVYQEHLEAVEGWLSTQPNFDVLQVSYNDILSVPQPQIDQVNRFLDGELDPQAMLGVINPNLYRNKEEAT